MTFVRVGFRTAECLSDVDQSHVPDVLDGSMLGLMHVTVHSCGSLGLYQDMLKGG